MVEATDINTKFATPTEASTPVHFMGMEPDICDLVEMSRIAVQVVGDAVSQVGSEIDGDAANRAIFAVGHVAKMIEAFRDRYLQMLPSMVRLAN
jgi:hypothetical protein